MTTLLKEITKENGNDWINKHELIDEKNKIKMIVYSGSKSIVLTDLTNAMQRGKTCERYSFNLQYNSQSYSLENLIYHFGSVKNLFDYARSLTYTVHKWGGYDRREVQIDGAWIDVYKSVEQSIRVFSPLTNLEPLKALPKKWTVELALRAIANKQYVWFKCNGHYTDDYAFDAAVDFGRGEITDNLKFVKYVLQSPSGWHVWPDSYGGVSINCHSFDCNSFMPKIN